MRPHERTFPCFFPRSKLHSPLSPHKKARDGLPSRARIHLLYGSIASVRQMKRTAPLVPSVIPE